MVAGLALALTPSLARGEPTPVSQTVPSTSAEDEEGAPSATSDSAASTPTQWTTEDQSLFVPLRDGTSITIGPHSTVTKHAMTQVALGIKDASPMAYSLQLNSGTIDVEVKRDRLPFHGVLVRAPRKFGAIVKTGRATITTNQTATAVAARSGIDMMVSVAEHWRGLKVGQVFSVSAEQPLGVRKPLLEPPRAIADHPIVIGPGTRRERLRWEPVVGSTSYLVRLYQQLGTERTLAREFRSTETEVALEGLTPGRYWATVAAVDEVDFPSAFGEAVGIRIVELVLPEGASAATDGTIHLPSHERALLRGADDLEMTYGLGNTLFLTGPQSVGLHDGKAVLVRLREKSSSEETRLRLEPLDFSLTLSIDPPRAVWPGSAVLVRVAARRGDGTPSPEVESLSVAVTINAQPVKLNWQRSDGEMRAAIEKPATQGPWVVRVAVGDRRGNVLMRDFLEVAERKAPR